MAIEYGYESAAQLSSLTIYQWVGKIFYGILRKELSLLLDRRDKNGATIVNRDLIEGFSTLHRFLQSIRQPFAFPQGDPFSVLVVNLHRPEGDADFHFEDNLYGMIAALRTRDVGIVVTLQDAGIISDTYGRYVQKVAGRKLLPIQFTELYAKCLYQVRLLYRTPSFVTATNRDPNVLTTVHMLPLAGWSGRPFVKEWMQCEYAEVFTAVMQQNYPNVNFTPFVQPLDQVATWMDDIGGQLMLFDQDGNRLPA